VFDVPDVALVHWPQEDALRRRLADAHVPRLLLIESDQVPPLAPDELEDWVRLPPDPDEIAVRSATLAQRARELVVRSVPLVLDADDVLHVGDRWVALAPLEARVLAPLMRHRGQLVLRTDLVPAAWPNTRQADERAVDGVVKRLRRRVAPLGVRIHTVIGQGFLLDAPPTGPS
jgi:DNA-binding response OmpR family regulator